MASSMRDLAATFKSGNVPMPSAGGGQGSFTTGLAIKRRLAKEREDQLALAKEIALNNERRNAQKFLWKGEDRALAAKDRADAEALQASLIDSVGFDPTKTEKVTTVEPYRDPDMMGEYYKFKMQNQEDGFGQVTERPEMDPLEAKMLADVARVNDAYAKGETGGYKATRPETDNAFMKGFHDTSKALEEGLHNVFYDDGLSKYSKAEADLKESMGAYNAKFGELTAKEQDRFMKNYGTYKKVTEVEQPKTVAEMKVEFKKMAKKLHPGDKRMQGALYATMMKENASDQNSLLKEFKANEAAITKSKNTDAASVVKKTAEIQAETEKRVAKAKTEKEKREEIMAKSLFDSIIKSGNAEDYMQQATRAYRNRDYTLLGKLSDMAN